MQDYYALLNVNPAISLEDLKTEIFNVKKIQTGRASGAPNADLRRKAEDTLKALETARKVFDSNASRANYDRELAEHKKNQKNESKKEPNESNTVSSFPLFGRTLKVSNDLAIYNEGDSLITEEGERQAAHYLDLMVKMSDDKAKDTLLMALALDPFNESIYQYALGRYFDRESELETLGDFFGIDLYTYKHKLALSYFKKLDTSTEKITVQSKEQMETLATALGILDRIHDIDEAFDQKLTEFDIAARTVDKVLFSTREKAEYAREEFKEIQLIIYKDGGFRNDEQTAIAALRLLEERTFTSGLQEKYIDIVKKVIEKFDLEARTVDGDVYEDREEATRERDILTQIEKIEGDGTQYNIEEGVFAMLRCITESGLSGKVAEKRIAKMKQLLVEFDIKARTAGDILYDTRQEASAAREEIKKLDVLFRKERPTIEASVSLRDLLNSGEFKTRAVMPYREKINSELQGRVEKATEYETSFGSKTIMAKISTIAIEVSVSAGIIYFLWPRWGWWGKGGSLILGILLIGMYYDRLHSRKDLKELRRLEEKNVKIL